MKNADQQSNRFTSKKPKLSVLSIIFSGVLAAGAIGGSAAAVWHISQNYTESPEFTKTFNGRLKIDPAAMLKDDQKATQTKSEALNIIEDCAQKLSRWLKDKGQKSYDVSYEITQEQVSPAGGGEKQYFGYLDAQFEVNKVNRKHYDSDETKKEKIFNDQYLSFFDNRAFNSNEKTLVYRWFVENQDVEPKYTIIPFRELFAIPKKVNSDSHKVKDLVDQDGNSGVVFGVESEKQELINQIFQDLTKARNFSKEEEEKNKEIKNQFLPRLYIVNNLQGLYNEANYHLSFWWKSNQGVDYDYENWYKDTEYANFAKDYAQTKFDGEARDSGTEQNYYRLAAAKSHEDDKEIENVDVFNYLDQTKPGDVEVGFANKYIDKVITIDDYDKSIPKKITDNYKNDVDFQADTWKVNKVSNIWYQTSSTNDAKTYLNNQIRYGFDKGTIASYDLSGIGPEKVGQSGGEVVYDEIICSKDFKSNEIAPTFTQTIFGGNNVIGVLTLGFLIFLILLLIILALLYRTTGVMSWICMIFALSMTGLIATIGSTAISMSLLFGLFTLAMVGFMASLAICGRMKRRLLSHEDTQLIVKKTFNKSLLPVADISIITLLFGVCFTYIAPISLNPLGLVLVIGGFATFISIYLLNGLMHLLLLNNQITINKFKFFGKPSNIANEALLQSNNSVPSSMDATKLEIPYYSKMSQKKIDATNKKSIIFVSIVAAILIIGIIVFSILGYTSSSLFHTTSCLAIHTQTDVIAKGWLKGLEYVSYRHDISTNWWYIYTNSNAITTVAQRISEQTQLEIGNDILIQNIVGSTSRDILDFALLSVLVATLCSALYAAIRCNWIAFVPVIAGAFAVPLLILGLASICQIKFDQFVVIGFVFVIVINTIFCLNIVGTINESWSRKDPYNKVEFKYIVNTALTNNWTFIWTLGIAYLLFIIIFAISAPAATSILLTFGLLIIGGVVTLFITPIVTAFLLYQFMKVRNFALNKLVERNKNKVVINYDDIDEQGIEGINKFKKSIPVSQETKQKEN